jgi:ribose transport system permease protein
MTTTETPAAEQTTRDYRGLLDRFLRGQATWTFLALVLLCVWFTIASPGKFLTATDFSLIAQNASWFLVMAVGQTFVILTAGIDLSVGTVLVLSGVVAAEFYTHHGGQAASVPVVLLGVLIALATGLVAGALQGFLVAKAKVPPLIVTLAGFGAAYGVSYLITGGSDISSVPGHLSSSIGQSSVLGIPWLIVISFLVAIVFGLVLAYTQFGQYTYAIGSNPEAAVRAGINVDRHLMKVYALAGLLSGTAGIMSLAFFSNTTITGHQTDNLTVITGVVLGGASLFGGRGTMLGTVIGIFIPTFLQNGLNIIGVNEYWQYVATAAVLVAAVYLDQLRIRLRNRALPRPTPPKENRMSRTHSTRIVAVSALAVLGASLTACSSSSSSTVPSSGTSPSSSSSSPSSASGKSLELIVGTKSDDFYVTMECGAEAEATKLGVHLTVNGPSEFSVPEQEPLIADAEVTKPAALLVAPTDSAALDPELEKVQNNGTKIVFVDTSASDTSLGISRISSDNAAGGKLAADTLGKMLGGKGTVAVISVAKGVSTTDARVAGFQQEMAAKFPGIKLLAEQNDDADSVSTATTFIEDDITANTGLNGAFAANVVTAEGVAAGVQHAGKTGKVKLATFDADATQMTMMQQGTIQLAIAQEPAVEGQDAVEQAVNALNGQPVQANIATPLIAVTPQNMNSASVKPYIYVGSCPS